MSTATSVIFNLNGANTTALLAQQGGTITFDNGTVSSTVNGSNRTGLRVTDPNSAISASNATIGLQVVSGASSNLIGINVDNSGAVTLNNTNVNVDGGANGTGNIGLRSSGTGTNAAFNAGSITVRGRGAFGVLAESGGTVTLGPGATIAASGQQTLTAPITRSHALISTGAGSQINGTGINASSAGIGGNAARAEAGGAVTLTGSALSTSGAGSEPDPAAAAFVSSGGTISLSGAGSTITATGQFGHGLHVQDAGSQAFVTDTAFTISGSRAVGVNIANGGAATISNSTMLVTSFPGIDVLGTGSTLSLTNTTVNTRSTAGHGIRARSGSIVTVTGGSIITEGLSGTALFIGGSTVTANGLTIRTFGNDNAMGALADGGSRVELNGGQITTSGNGVAVAAFPHAVASRNPGGQLISTGTTLLTLGNRAMGVVADDGGTTTLTGNSITTIGTQSLGLFAVVEQVGPQFAAAVTGNNITVETSGARADGAQAAQNNLAAQALITLNDSSVITHGAASVGLRAILSGTVIANRTTVLTEGLAAHGLEARDNNSSVTLNNSMVTSTGANAHGALANSGGLVVGNAATVRAMGANGAALYVAGAPGFVSNANFNDSTLTNVSGPTIDIAGHGNVNLTGSVASGSGQWLKVGTLNDFPPLAAPEPRLLGVGDPDGLDPPPLVLPPPAALPVVPGLANVTLSNSRVIGSAFTAAGSVSNVTLLDNSIWTMTGSSNLTNLTNDPSLIDFQPPTGDPILLSSYMTLTVVNYIGVNGIIRLNTYLGNDSSPSDRLIIDGGTASGFSPLRIRNTTGGGALTTANGILVVDTINGGTTVPGTFALEGPVSAGPYDYTLHRSSVDTSNLQAWYLRSTLDCTLDPTHPACAAPTPTPAPPNFRPETSLYAAIPSMALLYGRTLLDTLHERVGDEEDLRNRQRVNGVASGAWGRIIGQHGNHDGDPRGVFGNGPKFDYDIGAFQGGQDFLRRDGADGSRDHAGLYSAIGQLAGGVTHVNRTFAGRDSFNAYSLGGYWTHFGPPGWYLDAILQGTWYDAKGISRRFPTLTTNGWGFAGSLEAGYPIRLGGGFIIEPQTQFVYQNVSLGDGSDTVATVQFRNIESFAARIGARFARTWSLDDGLQPRSITAWLRPSVWNEFRGTPQTLFSSADGPVPFQSNMTGVWFELNAGMNAEITKATSLFANVGYQVSASADTTAYSGKIGLRAVW